MASQHSPVESNSSFVMALPASNFPPTSSSSRRIPPACWTVEETNALIDAYRKKWYAIGCNNLKATYWEEISDTVAGRCPNTSSAPKTADQCRHKMQKLRKRHQNEIQRARSSSSSRLESSWVHFKSMHSLLKCPFALALQNHENLIDLEEQDDIRDQYEGSKRRSLGKSYKNDGIKGFATPVGNHSNGGGFQIQVPSEVRTTQHGFYYNPTNPSSMQGNTSVDGCSYDAYATRVLKKRSVSMKKEEKDPIEEMANAIKLFGEGYVRMEERKMEVAKEIERMRIQMEMEHKKMILESQERIVEAFAKAISRESES